MISSCTMSLIEVSFQCAEWMHCLSVIWRSFTFHDFRDISDNRRNTHFMKKCISKFIFIISTEDSQWKELQTWRISKGHLDVPQTIEPNRLNYLNISILRSMITIIYRSHFYSILSLCIVNVSCFCSRIMATSLLPHALSSYCWNMLHNQAGSAEVIRGLHWKTVR